MSARTLTLRLNEAQASRLDQYRKKRDIATSSKAMLDALDRAAFLESIVMEQKQHISELTSQRDRLAQVLEGARAAAGQLVELAGQSDLFSGG